MLAPVTGRNDVDTIEDMRAAIMALALDGPDRAVTMLVAASTLFVLPVSNEMIEKMNADLRSAGYELRRPRGIDGGRGACRNRSPAGGARVGHRPKRLCVRFTECWMDYLPTDIASFPPSVATALVRRGLADPINPDEVEKMIARADALGLNG
jgi:hypothetical protein